MELARTEKGGIFNLNCYYFLGGAVADSALFVAVAASDDGSPSPSFRNRDGMSGPK